MIDNKLASRTIYYKDKDGSQQTIVLNIEFLPVENFSLGDAVVQQASGIITFEGNWEIRPIKVYGQDKLQVIYRLMCAADSTIRRISRDCGLGFFKVIPGDINEPLDVFA